MGLYLDPPANAVVPAVDEKPHDAAKWQVGNVNAVSGGQLGPSFRGADSRTTLRPQSHPLEDSGGRGTMPSRQTIDAKADATTDPAHFDILLRSSNVVKLFLASCRLKDPDVPGDFRQLEHKLVPRHRELISGQGEQ